MTVPADVTTCGISRAVRRGVNDAIAAAGTERDPDRKLTPHCLRHTFGSLQLAFGEALKPVSVWLGHRKVRTTERWYIHEIESMQDEAGDRMRTEFGSTPEFAEDEH